MKYKIVSLVLLITALILISMYFIIPNKSEEKKVIISLDKDNIPLIIGEKMSLKVSSNSEEVVTWKSSNSDVVSVSNGEIEALNEGEAIITASTSNEEAKCKVIVSKPSASKENIMEMHFIANGHYDDSILIRNNTHVIYIDGGRPDAASKDIAYLKELGIKKIDCMIGSHVEYDHVAAQADILDNFEVDSIIYPVDVNTCRKKGYCVHDIDNSYVVEALKKHNKTSIKQEIPSKMSVGLFNLYFLAPFKLTRNNNNNSFVFIMTYGNNSFMFTGDADSALRNPKKLISNAKELGLENINVDVFKHPHHGNETLSSSLFPAINTKYFIVPNYRFPQFPSKENLANIKKKGIEVYRQSDSKTGNILITSDGDNIKFAMDVIATDYTR